VSVDFELQLGSLIIASNVPSSDTCVAGGHGWANTFNARTGSFITGATDNAVSTLVSASVVVGINVIQLPGGAVKVILTTADNKTITIPPPMLPSTVVGHRVSWRELIVQ
jgi:type IV pilus assembly protein PilY1